MSLINNQRSWRTHCAKDDEHVGIVRLQPILQQKESTHREQHQPHEAHGFDQNSTRGHVIVN